MSTTERIVCLIAGPLLSGISCMMAWMCYRLILLGVQISISALSGKPVDPNINPFTP